MRVLIACEFSGIVREAFRARGHDAWSCDLLATETNGKYHFKGDVTEMLNPVPWLYDEPWDLMIAHPPCTYLCASGLHWNGRTPGRAAKTWEAIRFCEALWDSPIPRICIENPRGCLSTFSGLMKPAQEIQPYQFGEDASKATCLWLKGLPLLNGTQYIAPRITADGKERWANQTDSGQNKLAPSDERAMDRSRTYQGIADAMAEQWSGPLEYYANEHHQITGVDSLLEHVYI